MRTIATTEIAKATGLPHQAVLRSMRRLKAAVTPEHALTKPADYLEGTYKDSRGRERPVIYVRRRALGVACSWLTLRRSGDKREAIRAGYRSLAQR